MTDPSPPAHPFPRRGEDVETLLGAIDGMRGDDADWRGGRTFSLVYHPDDPELSRLQHEVAERFLHENALNPFAFPSLMRMEAEVVAMAADLLGGNPESVNIT